MKKLHLGCGGNHFDELINIDINSENADLNYDLTSQFPYKNSSIDFIYNEHFIEHLTVQEGVNFLSECHRVLKNDGVLRIATLNVSYFLFRYFFFWKRQNWIFQYGYKHLKTKAEMINMVFHEWGHQYLYNKDEMIRRLKETGFKKIKKKKRNKSNHSVLKNLETRKESNLVFEATK